MKMNGVILLLAFFWIGALAWCETGAVADQEGACVVCHQAHNNIIPAVPGSCEE